MPDTSMTAVELNELNGKLAMEVQSLCRRMMEMARVIEEAADTLPVDTEFKRIMVCAQVISETAEVVDDEIERVERSTFTIGEALKKVQAS